MAETDSLSPSNNPPGEASTENSLVEANGSSEDAVDVSLYTIRILEYYKHDGMSYFFIISPGRAYWV